MADSNSALSITPPHPRLYETSEGEQRVLGQLTPENIGGLYGILLGQRGQAQRNQDEYGRQLSETNALQNAIANAKLQNDRRHHNQQFFGGLVQHGQLPSSVAINATGGTDNLAPWQSREQMAVGTLQGDRLAALRTEASALEAAGKGLQAGREAGVTLDPGQRISGAQGMIGARATTGTALDLEVEALRQAGANSRVKDESGAKIVADVDMLGGEDKYKVVGNDPTRVRNMLQGLKGAANSDRRAEVVQRGGNYNPQGASPTAPGARPPPTPNTRAARVLTDEQGVATAAEAIRNTPELKGARYHSKKDTPEGSVLYFTVPGQPRPVPYQVK